MVDKHHLNKKANIYLVSDSSGETVLYVVNAVLAQLEHLNVNKFMWPMVRSKEQVDSLLERVKLRPGIIYYTIASEELDEYITRRSRDFNLSAVPVINQLVKTTSDLLCIPITRKIAGRQHHMLDDEYAERIKAIEYTASHDDGQKMDDLSEAQIVIIGVSRSSKSPTSLYLGQRGFRTANIPFIKDIGVTTDLSKCKETLIIGFTIAPERLRVIRENRLSSLGNKTKVGNEYTDLNAIKEEVLQARKFFHQNNIQVIDITGKAIEETAGEIMTLYFAKFGYT